MRASEVIAWGLVIYFATHWLLTRWPVQHRLRKAWCWVVGHHRVQYAQHGGDLIMCDRCGKEMQ